MIEKYPVGTKIRFFAQKWMCLDARLDNGKAGEIIRVWPSSVRISLIGSESKWITSWENVELLKVKGEQLLFSFMKEQYA